MATWVIVSYDIPDDGRRSKLHRGLRRLLEPVQKSVFEGELTDPQLVRLQRIVASRIDPSEDDVRIWRLCGGCRSRVLLIGCARPVPSRGAPLVV